MNQTLLFNKNWEFSKVSGIMEDIPADFRPVDVPHDWLIYDTKNLYEDSVGWYRKRFDFDGRAEQVILRFDGVYMDVTLFVNGQETGEWKYGYSRFECDITDALTKGENEILLKVVHQAPNSRWYTGAGIYRDVWLVMRGKTYIESEGLYISTIKKNNWSLTVNTDVVSTGSVKLKHRLVDDKGHVIGEKTIVGKSDKTLTVTFSDLEPKEWHPENPYLYTLETTLFEEGSKDMSEQIRTKVGFKDIDMDPNKGLYVNGEPLKLKGVCEHHDLGTLGSAFNPHALRRRFEILKDMGVNAVRTSHNMPAKDLMDLADEMGFLIVSESFDMWERPKTEHDYARFFNDWAYRDVKSWVKRDRNHVSLLMWTIGNEIYDTHADERGLETAKKLMAYVREFDPDRNAELTIGSNYMPWENAQKVADEVKIAGYNYGEKYYQEHHKDHPDWVIYGSETASVVQSRGIYHFPYSQSVLADDDEQCSALGNSSTSWGAKSAEAIITGERDTPYSMGQFIWTGFDYIGEPTPYHTKNAYFGQIDTATFKKDSYYIYQSAWTDVKDQPVIHLFPYWDFNPGQTVDVRVATNAPEVKLFLNGKEVAETTIDHQKDTEIIPTWQIPYEEGELKAVAYNEHNEMIGESIRHSFGDARRVTLKPDKEVLQADGRDLIFVEVGTEDANSYPVENATNRVDLKVWGAGRLVGFDNGDSTDFDQYKGLSRRLFSGKAMAVIQATDESGPVNIKATSKDLDPAECELRAVPTDQPIQYEVNAGNTERRIETGQRDEVPVRKIELISSQGRYLSPEITETTVTAALYPINTSYTEVEWSVVNDAGVEATNARIEVQGADGRQVKITAKGDGPFRVRCTSKNGTDKIKLISELDMVIEGVGTAYKHPYALVSGSLYDESIGDVSNGNERGVATSRDGETIIGFHDIDFGKHGSDQITLPIFALSDDHYIIEIWEGSPKAGGTLLKEADYQKKSIWNVYQEETYTLSKRLTGITSLYFVMRAKVHLKGFYFEAMNPAFDYNRAVDADAIYGDQFEKSEKVVKNIGNNVSLVYTDVDFGDVEAKLIKIQGHSPIEKNTIHVRFETDEGETFNQVVEFTQTSSIKEKEFELEPLTGKGTLTFVFLPGSQFDFKAFQLIK
ncbi:beta-galactosidase [Alkalibacterium putridalgicola]|uniref:Beta-galactosidase n=1 Tax=Alkalibacterium putridalgicola TaxID=426703 RepID=A0A1H7R967_9LACT|nr:glycoside hydrolase family 2 TIM barrel-domain containing protein [Alkalibacterium putridalgicola]GEK88857.1 hypothetical protein APU01nite_08960 [Alkalibacterium putridalgicola]SEL56515.1 beta-galactosidase [Alkalibacterium putridalgicola]